MLVLALDTTTRSGSVAVARDGDVIELTVSDASRSHAERLPAELRDALGRAGATLAQVDVFAVATGPGSFTGLRIGIATMQGLAFANDRPLVGISGLDALAHAAAPRDRYVATWVDAWRGEVYAALYDNEREVLAPVVDTPVSVVAACRERVESHPIAFAGDGAAAYRHVIHDMLGERARFADPIAPPIAGTVATLAARAAADGHRPSPDAIRPLYVRRPDAELARSRARGLTTRP
jgi:tRNA threonylcarbamoyladenosine biosynthesis protein TsaB